MNKSEESKRGRTNVRHKKWSRRKPRPKFEIVDGEKVYENGWVEPTQDERKERSKGYSFEKVDETSYRKWCESCGKEYLTVNKGKHFCNACFWRRVGAGLYDNTRLSKELAQCQ